MYSRLKALKLPTESLMVGLLASFFLILTYLFIGDIVIHFDEMDILGPIFNSKYPRKYGDFSYFFYSWAIPFGKLILPSSDGIEIARVINCFLYSFNLILFYLFLKFYFSSWWAFLGTFLFATSPGVFFSAVEIKTESLLLFEFLILAICLENFLNCSKKNQLFFAGLSGLICSFGISTKFFPLFPLLFISSLFLIKNNQMPKPRNKNNIKLSIIFIIFLLLGLFLTFPNIINQLQVISHGKFLNDRQFASGPNWFKSVDEFFSFPYGRYSYPLLTILPLTLGFFNYIASWISLIRKKPNKRAITVYLPFLAVFFLYTCHFNLLRMPNLFTLASPIIIFYSLFFWQEVYLFFKKRNFFVINVLILIALTSYSLLDSKSYSSYIFSYMETFLKTSFQVEEILLVNNGKKEILPVFVNAGNFAKFHRTWPSIIKEKKPQYIFLFGAFIENYCKYRFDKDYIESCNYFKSLLQEKEGYKIIWNMPLKYPYRPWNFDSELISNFFYLQRI